MALDDRSVLHLHPISVEQVVLRLLHRRLAQVKSIADLVGLEEGFRRPLRGAPVQRLAGGDDVVHSPDGLFDGRAWVGAVTEQQVDEVESKTLE